MFRKRAAPPGLQEGLEKWAVVLNPNSSLMKDTAETLQWLFKG